MNISSIIREEAMRRISIAALSIAALLTLSACSTAAEETTMEETTAAAEVTEEAAAGTIVDVAIATEGFATLVAAVTAADLAETLSGMGPFTVFAPTDAVIVHL